MKITYTVMSRKGDESFSFDTATKLGVTEAEQKFNEIMGLGHLPIATDPKTGEKRAYRKFDPTIEDTVFRPPLQGG